MPTKTRLTKERAVRTALALVDRGGLEALSMRALGRELGVDPMAVYHYLDGKEALYDGIVDAVWSEVRIPRPTSSWKADLRKLARAIREALLAHPNALPLVGTRQNLGRAGFDLLEHGLRVLERAGITGSRALSFLGAGSSFVLGHTLAEVGPPPGGARDVTPAELEAAVDPATYPLLAKALRREPEMGESFELGLEALIEGISS